MMMMHRTTRAHRTETFATTFEAALARAFGDYRVQVTRTEESTRDGELSLQHVSVVRKDGLSIVVGCANTIAGTAELRTLGHTLAMSKRRFGRELAIPPLEYMRFMNIATKVMEDFGLSVEVVAYERAEDDDPEVEVSDDTETVPPPTVPYGALLASLSALVSLGVVFALVLS